MALESKMPPDDALEAAREWWCVCVRTADVPVVESLAALILRQRAEAVEATLPKIERKARVDALERVADAARAARKIIIRGTGIISKTCLLVLLDNALAALDRPVREEEPVMPGINTEVPDVADD